MNRIGGAFLTKGLVEAEKTNVEEPIDRQLLS